MQRHALLMYTSCGWFFDELSGLETVQVIHYAGARGATGAGRHRTGSGARVARASCEQAKSNLPEHGDGARIYEKWVKPAYRGQSNVWQATSPSAPCSRTMKPNRKSIAIRSSAINFAIEADGKLRLGQGQASFGSRITRRVGSLQLCRRSFGRAQHHRRGAPIQPRRG